MTDRLVSLPPAQAAATPAIVVDPSTGTCEYCGDPVPASVVYCTDTDCERFDAGNEFNIWRRWAA